MSSYHRMHGPFRFSLATTRPTARGNTLVLVTAILVLLVIIATAFISRAQGGRKIATSQQRAFQREDHARLAGEQVAAEVAQALFPKPINPRVHAVFDGYASSVYDESGVYDWLNDGGNTGVLAASVWSGVPRSHPGTDPNRAFTAERYQADPGDFFFNFNGQLPDLSPDDPSVPPTPLWRDNDPSTGFTDPPDGLAFNYFDFNYAPYEVRPFTNWPDEPLNLTDEGGLPVPSGRGAPFGLLFDNEDVALGAGNPPGNPGYGDFRLLRDSEPRRLGRYYDGATGFESGVFPNRDPYSEQFSHWTHLSWLPTAENGWRVCYNISNVSPLDRQAYIDGDPVGPENGNTLSAYAFDDPDVGFYRDLEFPVALQTPYEQWYPNVVPAYIEPIYDAGSGDFELGEYFSADLDASWFAQRREEWFGSPRRHFEAATDDERVLPNFINLDRMRYAEQYTKRQYLETGNAQSQDLYNQIRDLRVEVERTFCDTDGDGFTDSFWFVPPTPVDRGVRQVVGISVVDNGGMLDANVATAFDRWSTAGTTPSDLALISRVRAPGTADDFEYDEDDTHVGLLVDPKNAVDNGGAQSTDRFEGHPFFEKSNGRRLFQRYRPERWYATGPDLIDDPTFLNMRGLSELRFSSFAGAEGPFYGEFQALLDPGSFKDEPETAAWERRLWNRAVQRDGRGAYVRSSNGNDVLVPFTITPFDLNDELELRGFSGQNNPYTYSRFERSLDDIVSVGHVNDDAPGSANAHYSILRSSMDRQETTPFKRYPYRDLQYDNGELLNGGLSHPTAGKLSNEQLVRDLRHRITLYSGTRNETRPMWLWSTPFYNPLRDYDGDEESGTSRDFQEYQRRKLKIDLRQSYALPTNITGTVLEGDHYTQEFDNLGYPALPGSWAAFQNQRRWLNDLQETIELNMVFAEDLADDQTWQSYFSSPLYQLDLTDPTQYRFQTDPFSAYRKSYLAAASMTANIESFRDGPSQPYNVFDNGQASDTVWVDPPLHPIHARRVEDLYGTDPDDQPAVDAPYFEPEGFVGLEKQPFIMQTYFGLVYPKSEHPEGPTPDTQYASGDYIFPGNRDEDPIAQEEQWEAGHAIPQQFTNEAYFDSNQGSAGQPGNLDENRNYVDGTSKPAIVIAIQLGNPFDEPVSLADFCMRVGDYDTSAPGKDDEYLWFAEMACPHTIIQPGHPDSDSQANPSNYNGYFPNELVLGPTEPDAPRSAIIFAVIPPERTGLVPPLGGGDPDAWADGSWDSADFENIDYATFRDTWLDELDLEPGNLFGYEPEMPLRYHQTLVFDVSRLLHEGLPGDSKERLEALFDEDNDRVIELIRQVEDPTIKAYLELPLNDIEDIPGVYVPNDWTGQDVTDFYRMEYVVDRINHERPDDSDPRHFDFLETLKDLIPPALAVGSDLENQYDPPLFDDDLVDDFRNFEIANSAFDDDPTVNGTNGVDTIEFDEDNQWGGIHIGSDDFYLTWAHASRAWGWDVDNDGLYDMDEISPRYIFSMVNEVTSSGADLDYSRLRGNQLYDVDNPTVADDPGFVARRRSRLPGVLATPIIPGGSSFRFTALDGNQIDELRADPTQETGDPGSIPPANTQPDDPALPTDAVFGFRGDSFDTAVFTSQTDDYNEEPGMMAAIERIVPLGNTVLNDLDLDVDKVWWIKAKPTNFTTWTALDLPAVDEDLWTSRYAVSGVNFPIRVFSSSNSWNDFPTGYALEARDNAMLNDTIYVPMDLGGSKVTDLDEGMRGYLWNQPLQMLLKDNDFEQIGELSHVFLWGPVLQLPDAPVPQRTFGDPLPFEDTLLWQQWRNMPHPIGDEEDGFAVVRTFSEVMTEIAEHQDYLNATPIDEGGFGLSTDFVLPPSDLPGGGAAPPGPADAYPVGYGALANRLDMDLGYNQDGGDFLFERPWRQVLGGGRFTNLPAYRPKLPAGAGLFDSVTVDGRGLNVRHPDLNVDDTYTPQEALRAEVDRFDLVHGFSNKPTKGLLNINTASPEVLRALPQMSRLVYNDYFEDPAFADFRGRFARSATWAARGEVRFGHTSGQPDSDGAYSNHKHIRLAESVERYRTGDALLRSTKDFRLGIPPEQQWIPQPSMADRGFTGTDWGDTDQNDVRYDDIPGYYGFFPGMRNERGLVSLGELLTMQRTSFEEFELVDPDGDGTGDGPDVGGWIYRSQSVRALGNSPYGNPPNFVYPGDDPTPAERFFIACRGYLNDELPSPAGGGGKLIASQADARVSTDRNTLRRTILGRRNNQPYFNPNDLSDNIPVDEYAPDMVSGDAEEMNLLFSGMANMITTRSDVFTVYMTIRTFKQDPVSGVWDASKEENIIDQSRYVMIVDRTEVDSPTQRPEIRAFSKVE